MEKSYFLRSLDSLCLDISVNEGHDVILGRGPLTKIKDSRLSRCHLTVTGVKEGATVRLSGHNTSVVNGRRLSRVGEVQLLAPGQVVELLEGAYGFRLLENNGVRAVSDEKREKKRERTHDENDENDENDEKQEKRRERIDDDKPRSASWSQGLLASMSDPSLKVTETGRVVVIRDKFPKSEHHFLVLPKQKLTSLKSAGRDHVQLLEEMEAEGRKLAERFPQHQFKLGYHAVPSMSQVHLHVISQDFNSPCLKHKKHWNSFTTTYFVPSETVLEELRSTGRFTEREEQAKTLLGTPLKCHKCEYRPQNFPDLKRHLGTHNRKVN